MVKDVTASSQSESLHIVKELEDLDSKSYARTCLARQVLRLREILAVALIFTFITSGCGNMPSMSACCMEHLQEMQHQDHQAYEGKEESGSKPVDDESESPDIQPSEQHPETHHH